VDVAHPYLVPANRLRMFSLPRIESSIHDWHVIFNNNVFELILISRSPTIIYKLSSQVLASRVSYGTDSYNILRSTKVRITQ
jgi:hypothetical protein